MFERETKRETERLSESVSQRACLNWSMIINIRKACWDHHNKGFMQNFTAYFNTTIPHLIAWRQSGPKQCRLRVRMLCNRWVRVSRRSEGLSHCNYAHWRKQMLLLITSRSYNQTKSLGKDLFGGELASFFLPSGWQQWQWNDKGNKTIRKPELK